MRSATSKAIIPNGNPKSRKSKAKCKSCQAVHNNPKLRERYYRAWFEREAGDGSETLEMIGQELGISNNAIYRHAHNHMRMRVKKIQATEQKDQEVATLKAQAMKELEVSFDHGVVIPKEEYEMAVDAVISDGIAQMKVGSKDITINQLLAAAKLKGEWKLKKRGQDTELIKMMFRSASGYTQERTNTPTDRITSESSVVGGTGQN